MIEAIRCGCLVIHPGLAALPETASGMTVMYDFHENHTTHANTAYKYAKNILTLENKNIGFINTFASDSGREMNKNSIETYKTKWVSLLEQLKKQS
jgi:hypothetical protein